MSRKPKSKPQQGTTLLKLHALTLVAPLAIAIIVFLDPRAFSLGSFMPCLTLLLFGSGALFLLHLCSHRFYMAREQHREDLYFESLRMQENDDEPTEADARRQALLSVKHRLAETRRHPSPAEANLATRPQGRG